MEPVIFRAIVEPAPGPAWQAEWARLGDSYLAWFAREGDAARPPYGECVRAIREHMPELLGVYETLTTLAGDTDTVARLLSLWKPTPYLTACSQVVCTKPEPVLIRNYDYSPLLFEGALWTTAWAGKRVMGMGDCLWGLLDGVNEDGLAVSLAFGGDQRVGEGFGIPLVLRYVLQTCGSVREATRALTRIPVHMAYNVTLCDKSGNYATVVLTPGTRARVTKSPVATNNQGTVRWREFEQATSSIERERALRRRWEADATNVPAMIDAMLSPPVYAGAHAKGWGTLYTAAYWPERGAVELRWPGRRVTRTMDEAPSWEIDVALSPS